MPRRTTKKTRRVYTDEIKQEAVQMLLEMTEYKYYSEALKEITSYIEYYNVERRHSSLDYLSPVQFELAYA